MSGCYFDYFYEGEKHILCYIDFSLKGMRKYESANQVCRRISISKEDYFFEKIVKETEKILYSHLQKVSKSYK